MPKSHIKFLDNFSDKIYGNVLNTYKEKFIIYKQLCSELEEAKNQATLTDSQIDFLKFQITEIENANIEDENEYDLLKEELSVLENAEKLKELAYSSYWTLSGDENSIINSLSVVKSNLRKIGELDNSASNIEENFINALELLQETASNVENYANDIENDTQRLDEIQERLFLLDKLRRKYGATLSDILTTYSKLKEDYNNIETSSNKIIDLENKINKSLKELNTLADELSVFRQKSNLAELIVKELSLLDLPKVKFKISIEDTELSQYGKDKVEFLISTNVSEDLKPLSKVASGGEISRVMLAIKSILAESDNIDTIIFDEIDTGISGKASQSVADELEKLSKSHQIIVITHQPIIASKANKHFHVKKSQDENTKVEVKVLSENEKIKAIAELAAGDVTEQSLKFAQSLLN
jgi:DNA repair protein RecN (Recombination protein N)